MSVNKYFNLGKNILFPINRSITGKGVRDTLKIIKSEFPILNIKKIKSGSKVYDWVIPPEWNVNTAYIKDKSKKKIIDFKNNNLHLMGYSRPINKILNKDQLLKRIYTLKKQPNAIPYVTSYYKKNWAFCTTHKNKNFIKKNYKKNDSFHVLIKSKFKNDGYLNYGELVIPGASKKEILISTYICHPSMANNELSGPIVSMSLIDYFKKKKNKYSLRFIFIPETIGSIAYINKNFLPLKEKIIGGFNLSCIGDEKKYSCMLTKNENSVSDKCLLRAFKKLKINFKKFSFLKRGSDERQYNSPGVDLPIASIFRSKYGVYKEYHTSLDTFGKVVTLKGIIGGYNVAKTAIKLIMKEEVPKNNIICEPQLGKRNLYSKITYKENKKTNSRDYLNFLQYSDGLNTLSDISRKIKLDIKKTKKIFKILKEKKIVY